MNKKVAKPRGNARKPGKGEGNRQSQAAKPPKPKICKRK